MTVTEKNLAEKKTVEAASTTVVQEKSPTAVKIVNPHLTLIVRVFGLPDYKRTGLSTNVMKAGRGWIRARGLSVTLEGVVTENTPDAGDEVDHEGAKVKADRRMITFSEECIKKSGKTVIVPTPRAAKAKAEDDGAEANAKDQPKAKANAKDQPKAKAKAVAKVEDGDTPADW